MTIFLIFNLVPVLGNSNSEILIPTFSAAAITFSIFIFPACNYFCEAKEDSAAAAASLF